MDDVLGMMATPFYALLDFALDAPGPAAGIAAAIGLAIAYALAA